MKKLTHGPPVQWNSLWVNTAKNHQCQTVLSESLTRYKERKTNKMQQLDVYY